MRATTRKPEEVRRGQILQAAFDVAGRDGIAGLTVRAVAAEAGISHALVLFHFGRKERLIHGLLDWVIEATSVLHISEDIARFPHARDRLHALLELGDRRDELADVRDPIIGILRLRVSQVPLVTDPIDDDLRDPVGDGPYHGVALGRLGRDGASRRHLRPATRSGEVGGKRGPRLLRPM